MLRVAVIVALIPLWACGEQSRASKYEILSGTVEGVRAETGQLRVRPDDERHGRDENRKVACLLTSDAEVYINDRFSSFDAIEIGDAVELVGYREQTPHTERFVVALAQITRNEPPPPEPELASPSTQPTSQRQEK